MIKEMARKIKGIAVIVLIILCCSGVAVYQFLEEMHPIILEDVDDVWGMYVDKNHGIQNNEDYLGYSIGSKLLEDEADIQRVLDGLAALKLTEYDKGGNSEIQWYDPGNDRGEELYEIQVAYDYKIYPFNKYKWGRMYFMPNGEMVLELQSKYHYYTTDAKAYDEMLALLEELYPKCESWNETGVQTWFEMNKNHAGFIAEQCVVTEDRAGHLIGVVHYIDTKGTDCNFVFIQDDGVCQYMSLKNARLDSSVPMVYEGNGTVSFTIYDTITDERVNYRLTYTKMDGGYCITASTE